jgi:hypothetical protein
MISFADIQITVLSHSVELPRSSMPAPVAGLLCEVHQVVDQSALSMERTWCWTESTRPVAGEGRRVGIEATSAIDHRRR